MVYSNTRMVFLVSCIFSLLEVLSNAFEVQFFQGFILPPFTDTDSMQAHAAQIFIEVETLLNNAVYWGKCISSDLHIFTS